MARQEATATKSEAIFGVEPTLEGQNDIDSIDRQLTTMWDAYVRQRLYENPVSLSKFFGHFTAMYGYFYIIVNRHKLATDQAVTKQTAEIYEQYGKASVTERDGVIRRAERSLRSKSDYYMSQVSWAKGCVNAMQTMLRLYGDESKMSGGFNA
jgi:hypothetical protein